MTSYIRKRLSEIVYTWMASRWVRCCPYRRQVHRVPPSAQSDRSRRTCRSSHPPQRTTPAPAGGAASGQVDNSQNTHPIECMQQMNTAHWSVACAQATEPTRADRHHRRLDRSCCPGKLHSVSLLHALPKNWIPRSPVFQTSDGARRRPRARRLRTREEGAAARRHISFSRRRRRLPGW